MEYRIEYGVMVPYIATVEADSPQEAIDKLLEDYHNNWPFEEIETTVEYAVIEDEEEGQCWDVDCCLEHPYQALEKLKKEMVKN